MNSAPPGFFKAFFGTCSGRAIFVSLRSQTWGKTVLHLLIISLITGVVAGAAQFFRVNDGMTALRIAFIETFGEKLRLDRRQGSSFSAIIPAEDPEKPRELALPGRGRLYYTGTARQVPKSLENAPLFFIVWTPDSFSLVQNEDGEYRIVTQNSAAPGMTRSSGSRADAERLFRDAPGTLPKQFDAMETEETKVFFDSMSSLACGFLLLGSAGRNFLLVWIYTGIFMVMYRLLNGASGNLRTLTPKEMWKCGIYASFPPMVVASFFPALDLPFLSFETVFMLGLLIYWMAVVAGMERNPAENEEHDNEH